MRRAQWSTSGVEVVDIDPGPMPDGWVRLQVTGCGICGSDLLFYRGMRAGILSPADFASPGHEIAGTIRDGPPGLADVVYAVEPWVNCQDCPECLCGATNLCETGPPGRLDGRRRTRRCGVGIVPIPSPGRAGSRT